MGVLALDLSLARPHDRTSTEDIVERPHSKSEFDQWLRPNATEPCTGPLIGGSSCDRAQPANPIGPQARGIA